MLGLVACGGEEEADIDPAAVLAETLANDEPITSATFDFTLGGSVEGERAADGEITLSGAFQSDPDDPAALPQLQLDGSASGEVAGSSVDAEGGFVLTTDNVYLNYQDETYELGVSVFNTLSSIASQASPLGSATDPTGAAASAEAEGATGAEGATAGQCPILIEQAGGNPEACETVDALSWFELTNEGTEEIEGAETIHIHAVVDVAAMIENINAAIAAAEVKGTGEIPEKTATEIEGAVGELSFDVYSGAEDRLLRGFDLNLSVDADAIEDAEDSGVTGTDLALSTRLGSVNEPQTIEAPADAKPVDDLLKQFGISSADLQAILSSIAAGSAPDLGSLSESR